MKSRSRVLLSLLCISLCAAPILAAEPQPAIPAAPAAAAETKPAAPAAAVPAKPAAAPAEAQAPKPDITIIRLNAPLLSPKFSSTPLATINDEVITFDDLKAALGTIHTGMGAEGKAAPKKNFQEVLKRLVNSRLMIQEARTIGLDKDELISNAMDEFKRKTLRDILLNEHVKNIVADEKEVIKVAKERTREWRLKSLVISKLADVRSFEAAIKSGKSFDELYDAYVRDERGRKGGKVEEFIARDAINPTMMVELDKLKTGEIGKAIPIENGYVLYRVEEIRSKDDPQMLEQVRGELGSQLRLAALKKYQEALTKKYVKMNKLFDKLDFESKKVPFDKMLKDKRVLAEIKGEKPITVANLADSVAAHFYHGVQRAIEGKKVNKEKKALMEQLIGTLVFDKEAKVQKVDQTEEYIEKVKTQENTLLFGQFMQKVVMPEISISREETRAYYTEHAKDYYTPGSYLLDAIAFTTPEKAEEAAKTLKTGTDLKWFKSNAEGQESVSKRYLAYFEGNPVTKDELPPKMQQALAGSAKGDYRVYVDGTSGYVLAVLDYQAPGTQPYEAVEMMIRETVSYKKLNENIELWAKKLRESSEVTVYADFTQQEKP